MSLELLINRPCLITTNVWDGETVDAYGNPVTVPDTIETVCELQQQSREERSAEGELSTTSWLLLLPLGTNVPIDAIVTVGGDDYAMDGESWVVRNPRTQADSHIEATLKRSKSTENAEAAS